MAYSVAKNTSLMTTASVLQKLVSFVYFTIIARTIGVANTGSYFFAIAFTTIFVVVADFGLGPVLTREAAKNGTPGEKYLQTAFWGKFWFGLVTYLLVVAAVNLLNYPAELKLLICLSGVTMFFDNLHAAFYGVLRAARNLRYEAAGIVGSQLLTLIIGSVALILKLPLYWLILAYAIPSFLNVIYSYLCQRRELHWRIGWHWDFKLLKWFVGLSWPFAAAAIIGRFYSYSDSLMMSKWLSPTDMGLWSVPYKIVFAFQFVPVALVAGLYPEMSNIYSAEPDRVGDLFAKAWRYLFIVVFPLALFLMILAAPVLKMFFGPAYLPAVPAFEILLVSLIFGYLAFVTAATLNATGHQRLQTLLMTLALVANLIINIIFLKTLGIHGAALAALSGNVVLCLGGLLFVASFIKLPFGQLFKALILTLVPAILTAVLARFLAVAVNIYFGVIFSGLVYLVGLFAVGVLQFDVLIKYWRKIFV